MAKWTSIPSEPFYHQPIQMDFLNDRRMRWCYGCKSTYSCPPDFSCPKCSVKGSRFYDRLTIVAGRRFGKTRIGAVSGVEEASIPGTIGWACAPTNDKLHRYVIPAFQQLIPQEWIKKDGWSVEHHDLRLTNGSLIHFQTLEDPDQGRGQGLDWLWIDEVSELTKAHWEVIRPSLAGDTVAFFTTSPRGFDWVYEELVAPADQGLPGYRRYLAKTSESANPRINSEFLAREKSQMSDQMYRQEYEADFVIFTGAVYGGSVEPQILRSPESIRFFIPEWPDIAPWRQILVGLDSGADHPFGAVKIVATENGLVVVGEYLERHKSFQEHALAIRGLANSSSCRFAINKNERQGMIELGQHGVRPLSPAENDVIAGTERVKTWLERHQLWFVESNCPLTVKQMKSYRWAENTSPKDQSKRLERVYKKDDELPDCLRYALMTWPRLPAAQSNPNPLRDISHLSIDTQRAIIRERKHDGLIKDEEDSEAVATQDFWL